jgi:TRAP-type C4-dicarboxylate transport system permease small subunit
MPEDLTMEVQHDKRELLGYNRALVWIARTMTAIGAVMLSAIMFLSIADITGRNLFNKPVEGTNEIVSLMVVAVGVLGLGYCQMVKGNINIDVFTKRLSHRGQAIMNSISYLIAIGVCVIVAWQVMLRTWDYMHRTLGSETVILGIPLWPFMLLMAICFVWVTAIFCLDFYQAIKEVFGHGAN